MTLQVCLSSFMPILLLYYYCSNINSVIPKTKDIEANEGSNDNDSVTLQIWDSLCQFNFKNALKTMFNCIFFLLFFLCLVLLIDKKRHNRKLQKEGRHTRGMVGVFYCSLRFFGFHLFGL